MVKVFKRRATNSTFTCRDEWIRADAVGEAVHASAGWRTFRSRFALQFGDFARLVYLCSARLDLRLELIAFTGMSCRIIIPP